MRGFWLMAFMMLMGILKWSHKAIFGGRGKASGVLRKQVTGGIGSLRMEQQSVW